MRPPRRYARDALRCKTPKTSIRPTSYLQTKAGLRKTVESRVWCPRLDVPRSLSRQEQFGARLERVLDVLDAQVAAVSEPEPVASVAVRLLSPVTLATAAFWSATPISPRSEGRATAIRPVSDSDSIM